MQDKEYAGLGRRFMALFIDGIILSSTFFPVTKIVKGTWMMSVSDHDWSWKWIAFDPICLTFLFVIFFYFVFFEGLASATPGKFIMHIRVVTVEMRKPGLVKSFIRNILRMVDGLPAMNILGVYLILTTPESTRFGDQLAGTRVIKK
ncbi:MAG: RDD family protein [Bacteroidota bacterium]